MNKSAAQGRAQAKGSASVAGGRTPGATAVVCPSCGKSVPWTPEQTSRPFCSERCRLIDLGEWASNTRRIPLDETPLQEDI